MAKLPVPWFCPDTPKELREEAWGPWTVVRFGGNVRPLSPGNAFRGETGEQNDQVAWVIDLSRH